MNSKQCASAAWLKAWQQANCTPKSMYWKEVFESKGSWLFENEKTKEVVHYVEREQAAAMLF
jgi:hypothetical protein